MTNDQDAIFRAYRQGYDDVLQYADISDNPYARGTKEFDAWRAGWCDGEDAWYHKAASE